MTLSRNRKAFLIWLAIMMPLVLALTVNARTFDGQHYHGCQSRWGRQRDVPRRPVRQRCDQDFLEGGSGGSSLRLIQVFASGAQMNWSAIGWPGVEAIGTWVTAIIAFGGILFVNKQLQQVERTIRGEVHERLTAGSIEVLKLLAKNNESYPYFYEGKPLTPDDPNRVFILYAAEIFGNYMENVINQVDNMTEEDRDVWRRFITDTLDMAPVVRHLLLQHKNWYSSKLIRLVEDVEKGVL